jgi:hypothetical protein
MNGSPRPAGELGPRFAYDVSRFARTDPATVLYTEAGQMKTSVPEPKGLAVGQGDQVYVAGKGGLEILAPDGQLVRRADLDGAGACAAAAPDGVVYVGLQDHVEVLGADGSRLAAWPSLGEQALLTSIAAGAEDVLVADAGNRVLHRFSRSGELRGKIGEKPSAERPNGFVLPSPYFDVALGPDETLWAVNPGELRVERFTFDGDFVTAWGKGGMNVAGFCGCCNPTHLAIRRDGSFVTSEKGLPRVKVYAPDGRFVGVVAGPEAFAEGTVGLDLAVDSKGRVLVLDPKVGGVRVFEEKG